jgi:hypothetical protein
MVRQIFICRLLAGADAMAPYSPGVGRKMYTDYEIMTRVSDSVFTGRLTALTRLQRSLSTDQYTRLQAGGLRGQASL